MTQHIDKKLLSYNEASGIISYYNHTKNVLNEYGEYEEKIGDVASLNGISPNYTDVTNEAKISSKLFGNIDGISYDKRIGYYKSLYVGHVEEGDYRFEGSSGGMGTWIFKELLERGLIDGAIQVRYNANNPQKMFSYHISRTLADIKASSKTKYYPVELSEVLEIVRKTPGRYAVIGIPSFIYALRLLSQKDKVIGERIKYMIGLICGHQKSTAFAEFMGWQMGIKPKDLTYINFRKKLQGRPSSQYGIEVHGYINGKYVEKCKPKDELLGQDWGQGWFKVFASDYTDDVFNETADMVLGDAWLPEYTNDSQGNNVIQIRNETIDKIVREGQIKGKLYLDKIGPDKMFQSQASGYRHTHDELSYRLYKRRKKGEEVPKKRVEPANNLSFKRKKIQDMREEISISSNVYFTEAVEKDDINIFLEKLIPLSQKYKMFYKITSLPKRVIGKVKRTFK